MALISGWILIKARYIAQAMGIQTACLLRQTRHF